MHTQLTLTLDGVAPDGSATGTHPDDGTIIFVADALPGERVEIAIEEGATHVRIGRAIFGSRH